MHSVSLTLSVTSAGATNEGWFYAVCWGFSEGEGHMVSWSGVSFIENYLLSAAGIWPSPLAAAWLLPVACACQVQHHFAARHLSLQITAALKDALQL
jgi:hypothetical protein